MDPIKQYIKRRYSPNPSTLASALFHDINMFVEGQERFTYPCELPGCENKAYPNHACGECLGKVVDYFMPGYGAKFVEVTDYYETLRAAIHAKIMCTVGRSPSDLPPRHFLVTAHLEDCDDDTGYVRAEDPVRAQRIMEDHIRKVMAEDGEDLSEVEVYCTMVAEIAGPPVSVTTAFGDANKFPHPINPL